VSNDDGIICRNSTVTITASSGTSYAWSTGDNTVSVSVTPLSSETYTVTVTDANGCSNAASTLVLVYELPVPLIYYAEISGNFNNDGSICNGDQTGLSVNVGTSYIWNNGAVSSSINVAPSVSTTYSVTVTDNNGCSATTQTSVSVFT
jgi:hypothetical protein